MVQLLSLEFSPSTHYCVDFRCDMHLSGGYFVPRTAHIQTVVGAEWHESQMRIPQSTITSQTAIWFELTQSRPCKCARTSRCPFSLCLLSAICCYQDSDVWITRVHLYRAVSIVSRGKIKGLELPNATHTIVYAQHFAASSQIVYL